LKVSSMKTSLRLLLGLSRVTCVLFVAAGAGGCVAAKHYDEARSVAETEMAGHARTRARLSNALARLEALEKDLAAKEAALSKTKEELDAEASLTAASKLEATVATTEKKAARELVEQLRAELARTGDHLRTYAGEKRSVEQSLALAEERLRAAASAGNGLVELVAVARDLAVGLADPLAAGNASLGAKDGAIVLGIAADELFVPEQTALDPQALGLVTSIASVATTHPSYRVELRDPLGGTIGELRTQALRDALVEKGVPADRIAKAVCGAEQAAPMPDATAAAPSPETPEASIDGPGASVPVATAPAVPASGEHAPVSRRYEIAFLSR
jgi:outer membrane protein OmpA-like peptidoglycan-associated protein